MTLEQNGTVHHGILTNYHVVRPSDARSGSSSSSSFVSNLDRYGASPSRPPSKAIEIECLARMDRDATLAATKSTEDGLQNQTQKCVDQIRKREMAGKPEDPDLSATINRNEAFRRTLRQNRDLAKNMPYNMGRVLATSGKAVIGRRVMDWAFVELSKNAAKQFFGANKMSPMPSDLWWEICSRGQGIPPAVGSPRTKFGSLEKGRYYMKLGRTTGVTAGYCNGALACRSWAGKSTAKYDHGGRGLENLQRITEEYVIVGESRGSQTLFAGDDGDSGAFVFDVDGQVCGLLFGAINGYRGGPDRVNAGLATSVSDLDASIQLRTVPRDLDGNVVGPPARLGLPA